MSDYLALLVTLECNYQPRVPFPALITLRWLRTSPIYASFAVLFVLSLPFSLRTAVPASPTEARGPRLGHPPDTCPPDPRTQSPDSDVGAPHVSPDRYHH